MFPKRVLIVAVLAAFGLLVALSSVNQIYINWLWFSSLGFEGVYRTALLSQIALFVTGFALFLAIFGGNLALADRFSRPSRQVLGLIIDTARGNRLPYLAVAAASLVLAVMMASFASSAWNVALLYLNATSFGKSDPIFGLDVGYYVFRLPVLRFVQSWLLTTIVLSVLGVVGIYAARLIVPRLPQAGARNQLAELRAVLALDRQVKAHLAILAASAILLMIWDYRLAMYELLYSPGGAAYGATYADVAARLPALWAVIGAAAVAGIAVLAWLFVGGYRLPALGLGLWLVVGVGGLWLYPAFVQRFEVQPSESSKERPYIAHNIDFTRTAYNLDRIAELESPAEETLRLEEVQANPGTIGNIRLWDPQPLLDTYNQIQSIRLYYDFHDIDVDRYVLDGSARQVMLAARELSAEKLPSEAQTWVNRRLQFTHGYGVAMTPVNEVTPEGLPTLWLRDVPPQGLVQVARPEIYYGEATSDYVIVDTETEEFDYPLGDQNVYARHPGTGGVRFGSALNRALFAWYFGDVNILISGFVSDDSRILFKRQIGQRARDIAPFLLYDGDPYVVVEAGRLFWIQDAYTYSNRYPYATPYGEGGFNYLRNSVKVVTSAYDGSVSFYVVDDEDAVLRAYAAVFPALFKPVAEMPEGLRAHLRYPQDLFRVQADMYSTYHMLDPQVFYNREDNWSIPTEKYFNSTVTMQPYYVITRLPGEQREEFVLIRPYTPPNKNNMITWLAARSDGEHYGAVLAYKYPKDRLVYGPMQIEARIDQDPVISEQLTLWSQAGSNVIRGNMIVLPIGGTNLYVEPIYLQAENNSLPEMKRIVLAVGNKVTMQTTVEAGLAQLYGEVPAVAGQPGAPPQGAAPQPPRAEAQLSDLVESLKDRYSRIQEEMRSLEEELGRLSQFLENGEQASAAP